MRAAKNPLVKERIKKIWKKEGLLKNMKEVSAMMMMSGHSTLANQTNQKVNQQLQEQPQEV